MEKPTYLFDFDGTLVDSMPAFISVMKRILDEHGISYSDDIVKIITPLGYHGTAAYFRTLGISTPTEQLIEQMNQYAHPAYLYDIPAKADVIETLQALKQQGASLNVLTASPHAVLDPCLKRIGIWELFDHVWSCDDFQTTKADPNIYHLAADRLGQRVEDVIFVDDNVNAVRTARQAGMRAWGIYDDSSRDCVDEMKQTADRYVTNFDELLRS